VAQEVRATDSTPARPDCIYPRPIFHASCIGWRVHERACKHPRPAYACSIAACTLAQYILPCPQRLQSARHRVRSRSYRIRPAAAAMSHARPAADSAGSAGMPLAHHCSASSCEHKAARCVALGHLGQLRQAAAPRRATARRAGRAVLCRAVPCVL
jgi:hypothetical protein